MTTTQTKYRQAPAAQNGEPVVGIHCPKCMLWLTRYDWENRKTEYVGFKCKQCGLDLTDSEGAPDTRETLSIIHEDYYMYEPENADSVVKDHVWFHVTHQKDWLKEEWSIYGDYHYPHVGTPMTVRDLYLQQYPNDTDMKVYVVRIKGDATVKSGAAMDDAVTSWKRVMLDNDQQTIRYVNDYENPGAISLVTTVESIEILDSAPFTNADDLAAKVADFTEKFSLVSA